MEMFRSGTRMEAMCEVAAQWGADQELEACIDFFGDQYTWDQLSGCTYWKQFRDDSESLLRAARRPEPPSLKEQALEAAKRFYAQGHECCTDEEVAHDFNIICRALEALPND